MKTIGFKWVALFVVSVCAVSVSAQSDLTVKVKNIRSAKGKVMIAADKGQYAMVDATGDTVTLVLKKCPKENVNCMSITMKTVIINWTGKTGYQQRIARL